MANDQINSNDEPNARSPGCTSGAPRICFRNRFVIRNSSLGASRSFCVPPQHLPMEKYKTRIGDKQTAYPMRHGI
jgi:hypothetical protein